MMTREPDSELHDFQPDRKVTPPGGRLRSQREKQGLSQKDVAAQLRLTSAVVDALERDDYNRLPAPIFVRGYLRSYASLLDLPAEEIVEAYAASTDASPPPLVANAGPGQAPRADRWVRPASYLIALGLVALVVAWGLNETGWFSESPSGVQVAGENSAPPASDDAPARAKGEEVPPSREVASGQPEIVAAEPEPEPAPQTGAGAVPASAAPETVPAGQVPADQDDEQADGSSVEGEAPTTPEPAPARQPVQPVATAEPTAGAQPEARSEQPQPQPSAELDAPRSAEEAPAAPGAERAAAQSAPGGGAETVASVSSDARETDRPAAEAASAPGRSTGQPDRLTLRFSRNSWVEVRDASGKRLVYDLARAGQERVVEGKAPFQVLLGNAEGAQVWINGEAFDHSRFRRGDVARFRLGGEANAVN